MMLSESVRGKIVLLHSQGMSQVNISKLLKCSRCAVQKTLKRLTVTRSTIPRPRVGRKRITTAVEDRILTRTSLKNRRMSSSKLAGELSAGDGTQISSRTVRRRLNEAGLMGRKARKKPWLSEVNR